MLIRVVLLLCLCVSYGKGKVVIDTLEHGISGDDFYKEYMSKSKMVVMKNLAKTWTLYDQIQNDNLDEKVANMAINQNVISHSTYGGEATTLGDFIHKSIDGRMFKHNATEEKFLFDHIEVPVMILSCRSLFYDFKKSVTVFLQGSKTKKMEMTSQLRCFPTHTFMAVMSGKVSLSLVGESGTVLIKSGNLLYIPPKSCMRLHGNKVSISLFLSWIHDDTKPFECKSVTLQNINGKNYISDDLKTQGPSNVPLNSGVEAPAMIFGTKDLKDDKAYELVKTAITIGYRGIDTSPVFENEKEIGRAVKDSKVPRNDLFLSTKLSYKLENTVEAAVKSVTKSLKKLQIDYLDLVTLHAPYDMESCEKGNCKLQYKRHWKGLRQLQDEGKIRALGVSNVQTVNHLKKILKITGESLSVVQNLMDPFIADKKVREFCLKKNIAYYAHSTRGSYWMDTEMGGAGWSFNPVFNHPTITTLARLMEVEPNVYILHWALERADGVIVSSTNPDHIESTFYMFQLLVRDTAIKWMDRLDETLVDDNSMNLEKFLENNSIDDEEARALLYEREKEKREQEKDEL